MKRQKQRQSSPGSFWIVGSGHYGMIAVERVHQKWPGARLTVIDHNPDKCSEVVKFNEHCATMDGVAFLIENLAVSSRWPEWIIPVIPIHVAFEWIKKMLERSHRIDQKVLPDEFVQTLPNAVRGPAGAVYVSNADFICPDNCSEPDHICTVTKALRPRVMHQFLRTLRYDCYRSFVIQSHQICPGVGGLRPEDLFKALELVGAYEGPIFLSTACRCHGVLHAFEVHRLKDLNG